MRPDLWETVKEAKYSSGLIFVQPVQMLDLPDPDRRSLYSYKIQDQYEAESIEWLYRKLAVLLHICQDRAVLCLCLGKCRDRYEDR